MPLLSGDISFQRSAVMADVPEGGGPPNGQVVPDGAHNAIFPDIAEEARVVGQVLIRQVHTMLGNTDTDPLLRANVILAERPDDPNVAITMLTTGDPYARRSDIVKHISAMRAPSVDMNGYLLHDHLATMRVIQIFQRPGATPPPPMATLLLVANDGLPTEYSQLVRVLDSGTPEIRTFSEVVGGGLIDYQAQVVQLELMQELAYTFPGSPPSRLFTRNSTKTRIRETFFTATDSFHGAMRLTAPAAAADTWLEVDSIYSQIVPNTQSEAAVLNQNPGRRVIRLASSPRQLDIEVSTHSRRIAISDQNMSRAYVTQLKPAPAPGTIAVHFWVLGQRYTIEDDGAGILTGIGGAGLIDYASGSMSINLTNVPDTGTWIMIHWGEVGAYTNRSSQGISVRRPEYAWIQDGQGTERIVPGTLSISYSAGGTMRTVTDDGAGQLTGAGTGSVDYLTRAIILRPQYMPGPGVTFAVAFDGVTAGGLVTDLLTMPSSADANGFVNLTLSAAPVKGSMVFSWTSRRLLAAAGGADANHVTVTKTAGASTVGLLDASASVPPSNLLPPGTEFILPDAIYDGSGLAIRPYTIYEQSGSTSRLTERASAVTSVIGGDAIIVWSTLTDDASGTFINDAATVNYATGAVSLQVVAPSRSIGAYQAYLEDPASFQLILQDSYSGSAPLGGEYTTTPWLGEIWAGTTIRVIYATGPSAPVAVSTTVTPPATTFDLTPQTAESLVPGSVQFTWMGVPYADAGGLIYRNRTASAPGIVSGSIDYTSGTVVMTDYAGGGDPAAFTLDSLWTAGPKWMTGNVTFTTQAAPLLPGAGGMSVSCVDATGQLLTAVPDSYGYINGDHMLGRVIPATGAVEIQFGDFVLDSSLTDTDRSQWWYDPAKVGAVEPGKIWKPWPIDPTTVTYNAVVLVYLPIDAELMGLDPTVFPPDGRVALATPGKLAVAGKVVTVPAFSPSNGMTVNLGQTRLSLIKVLGPDGALVSGGYTEDLNAGTITITDITGWPGTVSLWARQEVYHQIVEARVDGSVRLRTPLGIDLPAGALLSTALRQGDLFARAALLWTQGTWAGTTWKMTDITTGAPAAAMFDQVSYPVDVDNQGAITDLFALKFRSDGTTFDCYSRARGLIAQGNRNEDFAPINPATGTPIFTLDYRGWGSGWVAGNTLFVPIHGPVSPIVLVMSISPGAAPGGVYSLTLEQRGDVDNPPAGPY